MGGHLTKGGVAVEGKATTDPANAKANGQVSEAALTGATSAGSHMAITPTGSMGDTDGSCILYTLHRAPPKKKPKSQMSLNTFVSYPLKNSGDLQLSSRRLAMLVPAVRAPDLPFVNSVCCFHSGGGGDNLAVHLSKST